MYVRIEKNLTLKSQPHLKIKPDNLLTLLKAANKLYIQQKILVKNLFKIRKKKIFWTIC